MEHMMDYSASVDLSGESLFDSSLSVLHGLLNSSQPYWLRPKFVPMSSTESTRDSTPVDRKVAESLQNDLDHMQLPDMIRWRIQTAMPFVFPSLRFSISCQPPSVPPPALASLHPSISKSGLQRNSPTYSSMATSDGSGKLANPDVEIDLWTLLEDGAGSGHLQ